MLTLAATLGKTGRTPDNAMTDLEYDVLDELYFVVPFSHVRDTLELEEMELKRVLQDLLRRGWVKCFKDRTHELSTDEIDFATQFSNYFYLATKAGLLAHHGK